MRDSSAAHSSEGDEGTAVIGRTSRCGWRRGGAPARRSAPEHVPASARGEHQHQREADLRPR
ncbi:MAG: hypothetical protein ACK55I_30080, partial [bacterium]